MTYSIKIFGDLIIYYGLKVSEPERVIRSERDSGSFYWTGTHLLYNR
jgi:hypothetical protein